MDLKKLADRSLFVESVVGRLGRTPVDFAEKMAEIRSSREGPQPRSAAGVLLLLHFREAVGDGEDRRGEFCFQLIKRSASVAQPGDLSCPGGMLHLRLDGFLRGLLKGGLVPVLKDYPEMYLRQRDEDTRDAITLFLSNAIRESWEEIRLNPFSLRFLGPLPCHSLVLFRRTIFPLVGLVTTKPRYRPNREVDRIVEIPLASFFEPDNYSHYLIDAEDSLNAGRPSAWQFPCFLHREEGREPEILWGATFHIILRFLDLLFDFKLPEIPADRTLRRTLRPDYLTGSK